MDFVPMRLSHLERGESVLADVVRREGIVLYDNLDPTPRTRPAGPTALEAFLSSLEGRGG